MMKKRKPLTPRQKEMNARRRHAKKPAKIAPTKVKRVPAKEPKIGAPITPFIQATRWPRDISLAKVVKRRDMGDVNALAKSIDARGALLQPIVITAADELIAGQRRLAAWSLCKFRKQPIPVHVVDIDSIVAGEWDENAQRKDFSPSESVEMMEALLPLAKAAAKERQRKHGGTAPGKKGEGTEEAGRAEDYLAHYLGRDRKTLTKAKDVVDAAKAEPKKFGELLAYMDKTGKVNGPWRRLQVLRQVADIKAKKANGKLDLPEGKYDRIVADMPWPHEPGDADPGARGRATRGYPTMALDEMKAMPIGKRAGKDCVLYMWVTGFHMRYAYEVMDAWGFQHAPTILVWAKDKFGKGQRLREQTEFCIIAIKGKPVWHLTNQTTLLNAPVREDSRKPDEFYALIDAITPAQRSLELFARRELPEGWEGFGDQVGKFKTDEQPIEIEAFGNIAVGQLRVLDAIERGEPIEFNENDHVIRGLFTGKRKRKLTKAGEVKLAELRTAETMQYARDAKAEKDRMRLHKHAAKLGHDVAFTVDATAVDQTKEVATCSCGWKGTVPFGAVEELNATADGHVRAVIAAAEAGRDKEAKSSKTQRARAKAAAIEPPVLEAAE